MSIAEKSEPKDSDDRGGVDAYTVAGRKDALDFIADYPGYGEQRRCTTALSRLSDVVRFKIDDDVSMSRA